MELQGLQEALKVEIQCHQNQTICKSLNELQNGQKLAVRTCPVGTTKPLSLIKSSGQGIAISVVPAKAPVSMVTAHINGQKVPSSESLQTSPISLQTSSRVVAASVHTLSGRRATELPPSQMLGTLTAVPIKVPQVSSLHRLAGQAATVLPQVRPKTQIPDSLPHSGPCQELQPISLQKATAVVSPRSQGPTLPTANSTLSPDQQPERQGATSPPRPTVHCLTGTLESSNPVQHASAGPGVAYAIIAASPAATNGVSGISETVKVQPLIFSTENKVIIIQSQVPNSSEGSPGGQTEFSSQHDVPSPKSPSTKKDEDPEKVAFMVALGLVTTDHLEEIQLKRQERKRRSTANPAYSGLFEPERKRLASHYLNSSLYLTARDSEDFCWKDDLEHDELCAVCKEDGEVQPCHNCPRVFHPNCLHPPLKTPPRGPWYCPKCQKKVLNKENLSWPQNFVQSYVTHKTVRQEEKRRLLRRNNELKKECAHLEEEDKKLNKTLEKCMDTRERLLEQQRDTRASLDRIKSLLRLIQRDQVIQVTMTTTTTLGASLLSQAWMKPTSTAMTSPLATPTQKSHAQSQDNN
ncbi:PHD finger protein 21B [Boleophthalmus pectinirostris]|uniref:PHD finger protein 21B n=1 Tax=Boleophthalmus pectinirostris TaxID=150288 RepID=UPI00243140FF|nr:PHD finger protein 21B [Boleophthalmus pectinirostris]